MWKSLTGSQIEHFKTNTAQKELQELHALTREPVLEQMFSWDWQIEIFGLRNRWGYLNKDRTSLLFFYSNSNALYIINAKSRMNRIINKACMGSIYACLEERSCDTFMKEYEYIEKLVTYGRLIPKIPDYAYLSGDYGEFRECGWDDEYDDEEYYDEEYNEDDDY